MTTAVSSLLQSLFGSETEGSEPKKAWRCIGAENELVQLPCRRIYCVKGKEFDIALYYIHDTFHAIDATCPHMGGPLDEIIDLEMLVNMEQPHAMCKWHLYAYNLKTGESPQGLKISVHQVKIMDGNVYILYQHRLSLYSFETEL